MLSVLMVNSISSLDQPIITKMVNDLAVGVVVFIHLE